MPSSSRGAAVELTSLHTPVCETQPTSARPAGVPGAWGGAMKQAFTDTGRVPDRLPADGHGRVPSASLVQVGGGRQVARLDGRVHAELGGELEVHALVGPLEGAPIVPLDDPVYDACEQHHPHPHQVPIPRDLAEDCRDARRAELYKDGDALEPKGERRRAHPQPVGKGRVLRVVERAVGEGGRVRREQQRGPPLREQLRVRKGERLARLRPRPLDQAAR
mmetsp:Transcript_6659/g.22048  ORF Transcript_6659/g.22048 Transcript_6659/m.22048 type:complete len:220 (-) Transcript_6659:638-1297(-)